METYIARHPLRRLFAGITEQTFQGSLGVVDPNLIEYLTTLLLRFIHVDAIWSLRDQNGKRLKDVTDMLLEAGREGRSIAAMRNAYQHVGDYILFWVGTYPEELKRLQGWTRKDCLLDYHEQGKRSYWIASQYDDEPYQAEAPVLLRLSERFELCAYGLGQVRRAWEKEATLGSAKLL
jgi:hypothetical protein